jgi:uncharacterized membrane protein
MGKIKQILIISLLFILPLAFVLADDYDDAVTQTIKNITDYVSFIAGLLAVLFVVVGGVLFSTAGGNEKQVGTAKQMITYAAVGLAIVLVAQGITSIVRSLVSTTSS